MSQDWMLATWRVSSIRCHGSLGPARHPLPRQSGRSHQGGPVGGHLVESVIIFLTCP